jgi:hypothetical protein
MLYEVEFKRRGSNTTRIGLTWRLRDNNGVDSSGIARDEVVVSIFKTIYILIFGARCDLQSRGALALVI